MFLIIFSFQVPKSGNQIDGSTNSILKTLEDKLSLEVKDIYHLASVPDPLVNYDVSAICSIGQIKVNNSCSKWHLLFNFLL